MIARPMFRDPWAGTKWTKSQVSKIGKAVLGPFFRIWYRQGIYILGLQTPKGKVYLGEGTDIHAAFNNVFVEPVKAREKMAEEKARAEAEELEKAKASATSPSVDASISPDEVVL